MAKEVENKKRKASVPEQDAAKLKKPKKSTAEVPVLAKKRKATEDAAPVSIKKPKTPKSFGPGEPTLNPAKKEKAIKKTNETAVKAKDGKSAAEKPNGLKEKPAATKKVKEIELPKPIDEEEDEGALADEENEFFDVDDVDDQTEALLKGFESDNDDEQEANEGGLQKGDEIPQIPSLTKKEKKIINRARKSDSSDKPGVLYVGRIPHGFYENEMREFFKQFGNILKLRMSRNAKNGASRHFAFIQFESAAVAEIAAKAMDNYLMFNHVLKVKIVPDEQVHDDLFKGANKRFKKVPWNKIRGRELEMGASEATWEKRIEKEEKRRETKAEKMKEIGYEFPAPKIKSARNVAKKPIEQLTLTENGEDDVEAVEAAPVVEEATKSKKKTKKTKSAEVSTEPAKAIEAASVVVEASEEQKKKEKKAKGAKEDEPAVETPAASITEETSKPKQKKEKKARAVESAEVPATSEKKLKTKNSKTNLVEEAAAHGEAVEQKKSKKGKKVKADA